MSMKRKIILTLIFLVFIAGAVFAGYNIFSIAREYRAGEKIYNEVQQYISLPTTVNIQSPNAETRPEKDTEPSEAVDATEPAEEPIVFPEVDFETLLEINEDVVAWVYIEDTNISYPVVQGADNRYYVSTLVDGTYNGAGSIFMDYRNQPDFVDTHTVLYGHNMRNGTMFHDIVNYRDQEYYDAHPTGLIMTPEKNFRIEIVAAYVASLADPAWQLEFVSDEDALLWLRDAMARSGFTSRTEPELGDRIITLSTCSYEFSDARYVLVGVLKTA